MSPPLLTLPSVPPFKVRSDFDPAGDQPKAIAALAEGINRGDRFQTLLGITGSGKSATIAWTIEAAQASKRVGRVIVSTDDDHIAAVCRHWGAEVPFRRPEHLARSNSPHIDVVLHALDWLEQDAGKLPDYLLLLQPTSPQRTAEDIDSAVAVAEAHDADSVVSVCLR